MITTRLRRAVLPVMVGLALVVGLLAVDGPAIAEGTQTPPEGMARIGGNARIPDIAVRFYRATDAEPTGWVLETKVFTVGGVREPTDCTYCRGQFSADVRPGVYRVTFNELDEGDDEWHVWASTELTEVVGRPMDVKAGQTWGIPANLEHRGGYVTGRVTDQCGDYVPDVTVESFLAQEAGTRSRLTVRGSENGYFSTWTLGGPTRVKVSPPTSSHRAGWLGGSTSFEAATSPVLDVNNQSIGNQVVLDRITFDPPATGAPSPRVHAYVTTPENDPASDVQVQLFRETGDPGHPWKLEHTGRTGTTGEERGRLEADVPVGSYRMAVSDDASGSPDGWNPVFSGQSTSFDQAARFCVQAGRDGSAWAKLAHSGRAITGTVTNHRGKVIADASVRVFDLAGTSTDGVSPGRTVITDSKGRFTTYGLTSQVKLQVVKAKEYEPTWFGGAETFATATAIDASPGSAQDVSISLTDLPLKSYGKPGLEGTYRVGGKLWTESRWTYPVTIKYQWMRQRGSTIRKITGATSSRYTVKGKDAGYRIFARLTATPKGDYPGVKPVSVDSYAASIQESVKVRAFTKVSGNDIKLSFTVKISGVKKPRGTATVRYSKCKHDPNRGFICRGTKTKKVKFTSGKGGVRLNTTKGYWDVDVTVRESRTGSTGGDSGIVTVW